MILKIFKVFKKIILKVHKLQINFYNNLSLSTILNLSILVI
jgi:hypothetical protein